MTTHRRPTPKGRRPASVDISTDNIFADLGLPNPEEHLAKAKLTVQIIDIIRRRRLTQTEAAALLDIDQPKVSALMRGNLKNFSLDRLCRFLNRLDKDIDIVVKDKPRSRDHGETHIVVRTRGSGWSDALRPAPQ